MKTGSAPWLPCAGLPAAAGVARSGDGSCKSWGKVEDPAGWGAQRLLGLQRGPCTVCDTQGGCPSWCRGPLAPAVGVGWSLCHGTSSPAPLCHQPRRPARHSSALALAATLQPVSSAHQGNARRRAGLGSSSRHRGVGGYGIPQPCAAVSLPGQTPAQPGDGLQHGSRSVAAGTLCWAKGTCAPAGKLLGSSSKHSGV